MASGSGQTSGDLSMDNYAAMSACMIATEVGAGRLSPHAAVAAALARIAHEDGRLRAFTEVWPRLAAEQADTIARRLEAGARLPLAGVPLAVKATEGLASVQTVRLLDAGCVAVGATSTPGPGTSWQTWGATIRGPTLNPLNPLWSPGGSSAGSAVAVASGMVPLATGSDGAGSVRIPAAWCAILGLKPTNGLVPARDRAGLNIAGPLARHARDAAAYIDALTGSPSRTAVERPSRPLRVAWSATLGFAETQQPIAAAAHLFLTSLTCIEVIDVPVRLTDPGDCWRSLRAHGSTDLVARTRATLLREMDEIFAEVDLIATPTTPNPPHGHEGPGATLSVALTWAFNITGNPAISIPAGFAAAGDPVGLQLVARHGREADLLAVAEQIKADRPSGYPATTSPVSRRQQNRADRPNGR